MSKCLLFLMLVCGTKKTAALTIVASGTAFADAWSTQRNLARGNYRETDFVARPFEEHGAPIAYASTTAGVWALAFAASRMRRSKTFVRHFWWVPQAVAVGVGGYGAAVNLSR